MGLPVPNLDDTTFNELVAEARQLISRYAPHWTDHNVHDPGVTFIELFGWLAEMQIYQLNRVTDAHYTKFLKLVGLPPTDVQPAKVNVSFDFEDKTDEGFLEAGTQLVTAVGTKKMIFEIKEDFTLIPVSLQAIITSDTLKTINNIPANAEDGIHFAAFGKKAPIGATLSLGFDKSLPEDGMRISFFLFEEDLPSLGNNAAQHPQVYPSVKLAWEYLSDGRWQPLRVDRDETLALTRSGTVTLSGLSSMAAHKDLYWIRCRLQEGQYEIVPLLKTIRLNTVPALQIETVQNELLGAGGGTPGQTATLKRTPVIKESLSVQVKKLDKVENWQEVEDFESSGPDDPHYTFNPESGQITFGNGLNGRIPHASEKIWAASYTTTLGEEGNIQAGQKFRINKIGLGDIEGINLKMATGGKAEEPIEDAKARAKRDFRSRYRAITSGDYEKLALSTPGLRVARAKAIPNYRPDYPCITAPGMVTVVVVPYTREETVIPVPSTGFLQTVSNHLDELRLITTDVHVIGPEYVKISVKCTVHPRKRSCPDKVEQRVQEALEKFLDPLQGGPDGGGWPFGRAVFPSEIYQAIEKVEGVDYATAVSIIAEGQHRKEDEIIRIPPMALIYSEKHRVVAGAPASAPQTTRCGPDNTYLSKTELCLDKR